MPSSPNHNPSPATVAILSILFPGAGYLLLGQYKRALATGGGVLALVLLSVLLAGIRIFSVPGYDEYGQAIYVEAYSAMNGVELRKTTTPFINAVSVDNYRYDVYRRQHDGSVQKSDESQKPISSDWVLLRAPFATIGESPSIIAHAFTGPIYAIGGYLSLHAARANVPKAYLRLADVGSMYLVVAGMLNLMAIADAYARAAQKEAA